MKNFKRLGVVGCGNVGAGFVMQLAENDIAESVVVTSRNVGHAEAAVLDAGSAFPEVAAKFSVASALQGNFDMIIVTAGATPHSQVTQDELLQNNVEIIVDALKETECQKLVVIGTPVDRLTEKLSQLSDFSGVQIIGFGGQLDLARTYFSLIRHKVAVPDLVYVIGEHGPRAIPVYEGEENYETIRGDVTTTLKRILAAAGTTRNLATGVQLMRLVQALAGEEQTLCVSVPDKDFGGLSITWPYVINQTGLATKVEIPNIEPNASKLLQELLQTRQKEASNLG